ncbi:MAG: topoisomerase DNA-binding C4 zinc finger domain-containing protein, partial [Nanoarchaeota archaeon]|nr:topoisomerase DNA-binding C4 zinc finger domain-containing protein [Nanoarchaeota archaeon]
DCKTTFNIPNTGYVKTSDNECEHCKHPTIVISRAKKQPQSVCINPNCPGKESNNEKEEVLSEKEGKKCPKCKDGTLKLRKSVYGQFYGCSNYPKCRYTEKINSE